MNIRTQRGVGLVLIEYVICNEMEKKNRCWGHIVSKVAALHIRFVSTRTLARDCEFFTPRGDAFLKTTLQ